MVSTTETSESSKPADLNIAEVPLPEVPSSIKPSSPSTFYEFSLEAKVSKELPTALKLINVPEIANKSGGEVKAAEKVIEETTNIEKEIKKQVKESEKVNTKEITPLKEEKRKSLVNLFL